MYGSKKKFVDGLITGQFLRKFWGQALLSVYPIEVFTVKPECMAFSWPCLAIQFDRSDDDRILSASER
jgi:hypothetical protein